MPGRKRHHRGVSSASGVVASEKVVQRKITNAAEALGFYVTDFSQPRASMQTPGIPDLYLQHTAKEFRCWCEVKRIGGRISAAQTAWLVAERESGGVALVACSVSEFVEQLELHGFPVSLS